MTVYDKLLELNTRNGVAPSINPEIKELIEKLIGFGYYSSDTESMRSTLVKELVAYQIQSNINTVVLGMSGGIDSALTASLFKSAGYNVIGLTLPIHQDPSETQRGVEACKALGIEHYEFDLSDAFDFMSSNIDTFDQSQPDKIRQGNIRARLRMITLYNMAAKHHGFVASTDNFSELAAGFWTLHGDVGDVAPIQSLSKSWEVPMLAIEQNVPDSIIKAIPTDGLGVANGDEDQFGFSYMEFDAVLFALIGKIDFSQELPETQELVANVRRRIASTGYKRNNPVNLFHPLDGSTRYSNLESFDNTQIGE